MVTITRYMEDWTNEQFLLNGAELQKWKYSIIHCITLLSKHILWLAQDEAAHLTEGLSLKSYVVHEDS